MFLSIVIAVDRVIQDSMQVEQNDGSATETNRLSKDFRLAKIPNSNAHAHVRE